MKFKNLLIVVLLVVLICGCASIPSRRVILTESSPTGSITTIADIKPDGTFNKIMGTKQSKRILSGKLTDEKDGFLALQLKYENRNKEGKVSSINTQLKINPNEETPVGGLITSSNTRISTVRVEIPDKH